MAAFHADPQTERYQRRQHQQRTAAQAAGGIDQVSPEILQEIETPQVVSVFPDQGGIAQWNGIVVASRHFAMKGQLGFEIPLHSGAAEELQEETAHGGLPR
jgi:hypothetical protein